MVFGEPVDPRRGGAPPTFTCSGPAYQEVVTIFQDARPARVGLISDSYSSNGDGFHCLGQCNPKRSTLSFILIPLHCYHLLYRIISPKRNNQPYIHKRSYKIVHTDTNFRKDGRNTSWLDRPRVDGYWHVQKPSEVFDELGCSSFGIHEPHTVSG